jgi:DNA polymerase III sliding clamp (beta) subunit (PCNA family)
MTKRVNRAEFLSVLESVSAGLSPRETIPQSTCLVFKDGKVWTFNDEIACSRDIDLGFNGAVRAKHIMELLARIPEDEIDLEEAADEIKIRGHRKKGGVRMEQEILLPIEAIDVPLEWKELPEDFSDAINIVHSCASADQAQFVLTCVHIHPEYVEACDASQIARFPMDTGVEKSILVRARSLKRLISYDMTEVSETSNWIHFRNADGLVISCRRYLEDYRDLSEFLETSDSSPIVLPGGLEDILSRTSVFSVENADGDAVFVDLKQNMIVIGSNGASGWWKEAQEVAFDGEPIEFMISPKLLIEITKRASECRVSPGKLCVDAGKFKYVTCTGVKEEVPQVVV